MNTSRSQTLLYTAVALALSLGMLSIAHAEGRGHGRGGEREVPEDRGSPGDFVPPGHGGTPPGHVDNGPANGNGNGNGRGPQLGPRDARVCGDAGDAIEGPEGQSGNSHVAHVNFDAIDAATGAASDAGAWARMTYFWIGSSFDFVLNAHQLEPGSEWTLIATLESDAGAEAVCLGDGTSNPGGQLHILASIDPESHLPPDFDPFAEEGAEQSDDVTLRLVPSDSVDCETGLPAVRLPADAIVLESESGIRFVDTDEIVCPSDP